MDVHPIADIFPMLSNAELAQLAQDIRDRGQLVPILVDIEGRILDGRNRFAACTLAGVRPRFVQHHGSDPIGDSLALNVNRRHMGKGQIAMSVAANGFFRSAPFGSQRAYARLIGISEADLSKARLVDELAPELVDEVKEGRVSLTFAYTIARRRKQMGQVGEPHTGTHPAKWEGYAAAGRNDDLLFDAQPTVTTARSGGSRYGDHLHRGTRAYGEAVSALQRQLRLLCYQWEPLHDAAVHLPQQFVADVLSGMRKEDRLHIERLISDERRFHNSRPH
jgi:hypothetical protein